MKKVSARELKARCLALIDNMQKTKKPVAITKPGKVVAKLIPYEPADREFLGRLEGIVKLVGDVESPIAPPEDWKGLQ
ncbi:MAG TPA: type II toxin-antitoxin system prevent-host-death family antitoxin [Candidatus Acidoferrales bacterium]|nr:type II toxin-antitoxin system prevent-host-death family antitoxin [Candidatus Acidoferrales bacterium]